MNDINDSKSEKDKDIRYILKIKASFNQRITQHLKILKCLSKHNYSKNRWILEAIKEKIQEWKKIKQEDIQADGAIGFSISPSIHTEVSEIIQISRKLKVNTSKSEFFLDAISDKLNREEQKAKKLLREMLESAEEKE